MDPTAPVPDRPASSAPRPGGAHPLKGELHVPPWARAAARAWVPLGDRPPTGLADARSQLHHLVQVLAAFGQTFAEPRKDDSHRALSWDPNLGGFRSASARDQPALYMVVRPLPLEIQIRAVGETQRYVLPGHTLGEAWDWAERELAVLLGLPAVELERPEYEIPDHRVAHHALFDASPSALQEVGRWFDDGYRLLWALARRVGDPGATPPDPTASPVRVWPHHFDQGTLVTLEPARGPDHPARTVGLGLSPGDHAYAEPYLYVTPWPYPWNRPLPGLPSGHWHTQDWLGAVLTGTEIVTGQAREDADDGAPAPTPDGAGVQAARAAAFLDAAYHASAGLLAE